MKKAYPKYKVTDIPWLQEVPEEWATLRIKQLLNSETNGIWGEEPKSDANDILCIRVADFDRDFENLSRNDNTVRNIREQDYQPRELQKGDLLIEKSGGGDLLPVGRVGLFDWDSTKAVCSNFMARLRPKSSIVNSKYLFYFFKNLYSRRVNYCHIKQTTGIQNLDTSSFFNEIATVPPLPEQRQIAAFLDHKCALIDTFIQKKTRLIELLKEQKQAIINKAVTKGLPAEARAKAGIDPNVRLKPSGIDWLGDIPEHWEVTKIKMYCEVKDGTHDTPSYVEKSEEAFPLVTSKDFINGEIDFSEVKYISKEDHREIVKRSNTENGDIIMSMIGGNIGSLVVVNTDSEISIKNVALFKTSHDPILTSYLRYILLSNLLKIQIGLKSRGGGQPFLSLSDLRNLLFIKIPREEMKDICFFLNKELEQIDWTITRINQEIKFVKEYKTTLIAEAVTGKIDVRGWKAKSA